MSTPRDDPLPEAHDPPLPASSLSSATNGPTSSPTALATAITPPSSTPSTSLPAPIASSSSQPPRPQPPQPANLDGFIAGFRQIVEAFVEGRPPPGSEIQVDDGPPPPVPVRTLPVFYRPELHQPPVAPAPEPPRPVQPAQPPQTQPAPPTTPNAAITPPLSRRLTRRFTRTTPDGRSENVLVEMSVQAVPIVMPQPHRHHQQQHQHDQQPPPVGQPLPPARDVSFPPAFSAYDGYPYSLPRASRASASQPAEGEQGMSALRAALISRRQAVLEQRRAETGAGAPQQGEEERQSLSPPTSPVREHQTRVQQIRSEPIAQPTSAVQVQSRVEQIQPEPVPQPTPAVQVQQAAPSRFAWMTGAASAALSAITGAASAVTGSAAAAAAPTAGGSGSDAPAAENAQDGGRRYVRPTDRRMTREEWLAAVARWREGEARAEENRRLIEENRARRAAGLVPPAPHTPALRQLDYGALAFIDLLAREGARWQREGQGTVPDAEAYARANRAWLAAERMAGMTTARTNTAGPSAVQPLPTPSVRPEDLDELLAEVDGVAAPENDRLPSYAFPRPQPQPARPRSTSPARTDPLFPEHRHTPAHSPLIDHLMDDMPMEPSVERLVRPLPRRAVTQEVPMDVDQPGTGEGPTLIFSQEIPVFGRLGPTQSGEAAEGDAEDRDDDEDVPGPHGGGGFPQLLRFITHAMTTGMQNLFNGVPPDWDRARVLLEALDVVPPGLLRRLDRVEDGGGGKCAVCWAYLRDQPDVDEPAQEEEEEEDGAGCPVGPAAAAAAERPPKCPMEEGTVLSLPCTHTLHAACIFPWFGNHTTCPVCRFDLDPDSLTLRRSRPRTDTHNAHPNMQDGEAPPGLPAFLLDNIFESFLGNDDGHDAPVPVPVPIAPGEDPAAGEPGQGGQQAHMWTTRRTHQIRPGMWLTVESVHHSLPAAGLPGAPSNLPTAGPVPPPTAPQQVGQPIPVFISALNEPPIHRPSSAPPVRPPTPQLRPVQAPGTQSPAHPVGHPNPSIIIASPIVAPGAHPPGIHALAAGASPISSISPISPLSRTPTPSRPLKRKYTPPSGTQTLRERIEHMEEKAGLRCSAPSCAFGPSDDEVNGLPAEASARPGKYGVNNDACQHRFHATCLVTACRVQGMVGPLGAVDGRVPVTCPICRGEHGSGYVAEAVWEEGEVESDV